MGENARPSRTGVSRRTELWPGPVPSEPCTHLYTEASGPGCLDSPSPVNWSWCWCGYSGCWGAGRAWSCHSCSERSEMADSGWAGVRNASEERETAVRSTHPPKYAREEDCVDWPSQARAMWAPRRPWLCGFSWAGGHWCCHVWSEPRL